MPFSSTLDLESLSLILDAIPVPIFLKDRDSRIVGMNKACEDQWGIAYESVEATTGASIFPPEQIEAFVQKDREIFLSGKAVDFEEPYWSRKHQENRFCHTFKGPLQAGGQELLLCVSVDITTSREIVEALRLSEEKLRSLFEMAPLGIALTDMSGRYIESNDAFGRIYGYAREELADLDYRKQIAPEFLRADTAQQAVAKAGRYGPYEREYIHKSGARIPLRVQGVVVTGVDGQPYIWSIVEDISERKKAEERFRQSQKLEAIGQLTAGVAHDFNNLLTVIIGNLEMIADDSLSATARMHLEKANAAVERGAHLTQHLLSFSRKQSLSPRLIDLGVEVGEIATMLRRTMPASIDIKVAVPPEKVPVSLDSNQLGNALINLMVNARDAMEQGGVLRIAVDVRAHTALQDVGGTEQIGVGDYAVVSVEDTGCGMTPDVLAKAFDPFYTTKEIGRGSGLGLSMVYGFARQSNGHAILKSSPGKGTTVQLLFPLAEQRQGAAAYHGAQMPNGFAVQPGTPRRGRVLLVEDMSDVSFVISEQLERQGFAVEVVRDGRSALATLAAGKFDLLLTDLGLPGGTGGLELAWAASDLYPALRIITMSGYNDPIATGGRKPKPGWLSLRKPFAGGALADVIERTFLKDHV